MKNRIIPIVSVIIGVAAFFLTYWYIKDERAKIQKEKERIYAGARKVEVIAAARDIPANTVIKKEDLGKRGIYESQAPADVLRLEQLNLIVGKKTQYEIPAEQPLQWAYIQGASQMEKLAEIVTPGMRAMSLSVGGASAVSCMVQPDDHVDVLGTFTFASKTVPNAMETVTLTILQDVTVLAVGQKKVKQYTADQRMDSAGYSTVTLEVTPRESELLVFAEQMKGRLTLTLRNSSDVTFEKELPPIDFDYLENKLPELNMIRQKEIRRRTGLK